MSTNQEPYATAPDARRGRPPVLRSGGAGAPDDRVRVERIWQEIAAGFTALAPFGKAVSMFGSGRVADADRRYEHARRVAARLGEAGFTIIIGGGSGLMEAANRGGRAPGRPRSGSAIELPHEQD